MTSGIVTGGLVAAGEVERGALHLRADLTVAMGETVAVLGPNGAGKSTLLRVLAGLLALDAGSLRMGDEVLDEPASGGWVPPEGRGVGIAFQEHLLFPHMSALDNVAYGVRRRGVGKAAARATAAEALQRMGVAEQAGSRPATLSGGQAQRVSLARALAGAQRLLLLDEPLSALDAAARPAARRALRAHLDGFGGVAVVVTHDPVEAAALADRFVVLEDGQVTQAGLPAEVAAGPRTAYAADLVGVNLYRGRAVRGEVSLEGGGVLHAADPLDGDVLAVVHPRAVALHAARPEGTPRNVWQGRVTHVDVGRDRARVQVDGTPAIVAEVTEAGAAALGLAPGLAVWVSVKATEVTLNPL